MKQLLYQHIKKKLNEKEIIHNKHSQTIANKLYSYLQRKKLALRDDCPFEEAYEKIKKLKKFENLSESNIKEGYSILKELIKEKPIKENDEDNNKNKNNNDDKLINDDNINKNIININEDKQIINGNNDKNIINTEENNKMTKDNENNESKEPKNENDNISSSMKVDN